MALVVMFLAITKNLSGLIISKALRNYCGWIIDVNNIFGTEHVLFCLSPSHHIQLFTLVQDLRWVPSAPNVHSFKAVYFQ